MKVDFAKYADGLVPAVVQDFQTEKVLMLAYMNEESYRKTEETGLATFYSRSRKKIWTKGETSGNHLRLKQVLVDCDKDAILLKVDPVGPVCHTGADTCWSEKNHKNDFLYHLEHLIELRRNGIDESSYVKKLFSEGKEKIAQKLGENAGNLVTATQDVNQALFLDKATDLLFHYLILLQAKGCSISDVIKVLEQRHQSK
jgi:phosphoribosyl-AMP cyclohydrolase / phosphoribosyl-ATP pyrophosphohydrolase